MRVRKTFVIEAPKENTLPVDHSNLMFELTGQDIQSTPAICEIDQALRLLWLSATDNLDP